MGNANLTSEQIDNIQVDYGLVFADYGETTQQQLGPIRGGGEFSATATMRDIEFDGKKGKTKEMKYIDEINAMLKFGLMDHSLATMDKMMPHGTYDPVAGTIVNAQPGIIPASKYLKNITMFAKVLGGGYKRITVYNALNEAAFVITAKPKSEGVVPVEIHAHWDPTDGDVNIYKIEDVETLGADTTPPTVITVPADAATAVVVSSNLTATFNEHIREGDIKAGNFVLVKASDGTLVAGALSYTPATKTATFNPTADLSAETAYIWFITNVRDVAGNVMTSVAVNFTTA